MTDVQVDIGGLVLVSLLGACISFFYKKYKVKREFEENSITFGNEIVFQALHIVVSC